MNTLPRTRSLIAITDVDTAWEASINYPLPNMTDGYSLASNHLPATLEGLVSRFKIQAVRSAFYDTVSNVWRVSPAEGMPWLEDEGLSYLRGLVTAVLADMIENDGHVEAGLELANTPGIIDQVIAAAREGLGHAPSAEELDTTDTSVPFKDWDVDSLGRDTEDWWNFGCRHFNPRH